MIKSSGFSLLIRLTKSHVVFKFYLFTEFLDKIACCCNIKKVIDLLL